MKTYQEHLIGMAVMAAFLAGIVPVVAGAVPARAEPPPLPGIGAEDRRAPVDPEQAPWSSLVKIQTNLGGRCTGVLAGRRAVMTAAHCLYNARTRRYLPPSSLHVLFGYRRGDYSGHSRVAGFTVDPKHDPVRPLEGLAGDWAVLELAEDAPPGIPALALEESAPPEGAAVALGGYSQDKAQIVTADTACRLLGRVRVPDGDLLMHDCAGTRGTSGAALLAEREGKWRVVGIAVAASGGPERRNLAVPAAAVAPALRALVETAGRGERKGGGAGQP